MIKCYRYKIQPQPSLKPCKLYILIYSKIISNSLPILVFVENSEYTGPSLPKMKIPETLWVSLQDIPSN